MKKSGKRTAEKIAEVVGEGGGAEKLIENFDVLAEAAGGTRLLRDLILYLAVTGRLGRDPLASRTRRIEAAPPIRVGSASRTYPAAWALTRIGDAFAVVGGIQKTPARAPKAHHFPYLRVENVQRGKLNLERIERFELQDDELARWRLCSGDLLIVEGNGSESEVGRCALWGGEIQDCVHQNHIIRCRSRGEILPEFALLFLNSPVGMAEMKTLAITTSGLFSLSVGKIRGISLPMPPPDEQKRIVARVEQLLGLCDELEACQSKERDIVARLASSSFEALTGSEDAASVATAWSRIDGEFATMLGAADKVAMLRNAIVQAGISGKLLTGLEPDETATEVLRAISAERSRLVAEGRIRRVAPLPPVESEPFLLPAGWVWARLGELCFHVADGPHFSPSYVSAEDGVPILSGRNIKTTGFDWQNMKFISREDHATFCKRVRPEKGDILYTKGGTTGVAIVNTLDIEFSVWVHVAVLKVAKRHVLPEFLAMALNGPHCYAQSQQYTHGTGNRDLGLTRMVLITVPLPPRSMQAAIVARVNRLLKLCGDLEARLRVAEDRAARFAEAIVRELAS